MKDKIKAALIAKYKNLGFSDKAIEGVLNYLETTVTAEDQIDGAVDKVEAMLKAFQAEGDRRATEATNKAKNPQADPAKPTGGDPAKPANEPALPADMPEWMKPYMTKIDSLVNEVSSLKADKIGGSRKSQVEKALENVNENYRKGKLNDFDRMNFKDDEDFNSYLEGVKTDSAEFVQTETNAGLSKAGRPIVPTGGVQGKTATDKELDDAMSNIQI